MRIFMLVAVGSFFFVSENKVGLMLVMFLMPPVFIPIAMLTGVYVTIKADPFDVCLRREYMRLRKEFAVDLPSPGT